MALSTRGELCQDFYRLRKAREVATQRTRKNKKKEAEPLEEESVEEDNTELQGLSLGDSKSKRMKKILQEVAQAGEEGVKGEVEERRRRIWSTWMGLRT